MKIQHAQIDQQNNPKWDFMVTSLLCEFCKDQSNDFEVIVENVLANEVAAG